MTTNSACQIQRSSDPELFALFAEWMSQSDPWVTLGMNREQCRNAFDGDYREVFSLHVNGAPVGFVILQMKGTFKGYIQTLFIHPDQHRKGFGKWLLKYSEDYIRKSSPNIFICVSSFNTDAIRLYEQFGFKQIGILKDFIRPGFDELLYRKNFGDLLSFKTTV